MKLSFGEHLARPQQAAGIEIERQDRVAGVGGHVRVGVAGGRVDHFFVDVDGWARTRSRRPPAPTVATPAALFANGRGASGTVKVFQICLPVAPSSATMLPRNLQHSYVGRHGGRLFDGRYRHIHPPAVKGRRAGDARRRMILDS